MSEDTEKRDVVLSILAKPESERTLRDVKTYLDDLTAKARKRYEEADVNPKMEGWVERYYDAWEELDDAQKGLEGKAPVAKTIDYFRKKLVRDKAHKEEVEGDMPGAAFLGDKEKQQQLQGAALFLDFNIRFYEQAIRLVTNEWEMNRNFHSLEK